MSLTIDGVTWPDLTIMTNGTLTLIPAQGPNKRITVKWIHPNGFVAQEWRPNIDPLLDGIIIDRVGLSECEVVWTVDEIATVTIDASQFPDWRSIPFKLEDLGTKWTGKFE